MDVNKWTSNGHPMDIQWTDGFNAKADLIFEIDYSIKTATKLKAISKFVISHTTSDIEAEVRKYLQSDLGCV